MKKFLSWCLTLAMLVSLTACGQPSAPAQTEAPKTDTVTETVQETPVANEVTPANPVAGKKVAYVMLLKTATIFQMWKDSCKALCDKLGVQFDYFFCDGDFNKWQDQIRACGAAGYDGILISHGNQDGSYVFLKEITEQYPNMKIVTFDTQFYTDGQYQKLPGVTQMFQQDKSLVTVLLDQMIEKFGEGVRLVKVWRGPNFNSPFDRRQVGWDEYEKAGKIVTVGEVQPLEDTIDSANTVTAAYLQGKNRDEIDGVVAYYDLYGQGVYNAICENDNFNGNNGEALPMSSVDIDPVDITNMQTNPDIWTAAGTTDWTMNGEIGMRALLLEIAGEYDKIYDPATKQSGVDVIEVPGTAIKASALKADSTVENLGAIAGETYGNLGYLSETSWMPKNLIHEEKKVENPVQGKKVAYVMLLKTATIFQMWKDSCKALCDKLGVQFDYFFCDGDFNKWQDQIRACGAAGYDGILISHGNQDGSYVFLKEITEQYPNMKIVTFDTQFYTDGQYQKLPGVTQMFQQDKSLVTVLLDQMIEKFGEGVRLVKVWRGPNFNSPFDRRQVGWDEYEKAGKIVTVGEVQPLEDTIDSANTVTAAYLQGKQRSDIDGVIAYYDLYGQGVYNAICENDNFNGNNGEALPMSSVDIDPVDITNMQTNPNIWTAAGTTDWTMNGEIGMRALLLEIAGEYDKIYDPATKQSGVDVIEVPGTAIKASALKADSTVENLGAIAGETYGNLGYLSESAWMPKNLIH